MKYISIINLVVGLAIGAGLTTGPRVAQLYEYKDSVVSELWLILLNAPN